MSRTPQQDRHLDFYIVGLTISRVLQNLDAMIIEMQGTLPIMPHNRELSAIMEDLRTTRERLIAEYRRLLDRNMPPA